MKIISFELLTLIKSKKSHVFCFGLVIEIYEES